MRILHLFHNPVGMDAAPRLALLAAGLGRLDFVRQDVWMLGGSELANTARELAVRKARLISTPFNHACLALPAAGYHLRHHEYDLLHCWSLASLALAMSLRPRVPRVLMVTSPMSIRQIHALRFMLSDRRATTVVLTISSTLQRDILTGGVPEQVVHVMRPGMDLGMVLHGTRMALRQRWGVEKVGGEPKALKSMVIGILVDAVARVDARQLVLVIGLAEEAIQEAGYRLYVLVHPCQAHLLRARKTLEALGKAYQCIVEPRVDRPWEVLPGCDLAVGMEAATGGLALLWGMAANVPLVGQASYTHCEVLEDRHSALLAQPDQPIDLARRISQLVTDSTLAWKLRDTARHEAFSYFSRVRHAQALQKVYEQIVSGLDVQVPAMISTGGLRFEAAAASAASRL